MEDKLKQLGLTDNEIKVYLCVLENTKITPALIARKTGVTRPTAYGVGKSLVEKGYIEADQLSPTLYFVALPPENISKIIKKERLELEEKLKTAESLVSELTLVPRSKNYSIPKVKFIDEINFEKYIYEKLPTWVESSKNSDGMYWGFQDSSLIEKYPEWVKWHWESTPDFFSMRLFTNKKPVEEDIGSSFSKKRRQVKYMDDSLDFSGTHVVVGDYVLFFMTRQHPHYLVEINDSVMAENLRRVFKRFWEMVE
jgi:sugar-specific transcriptional regulator TrmB